ncbi:MAG: Coenzyme PQQ synthesis protein D [Chloroflexi bacterium ADurb.Bin325]|nr:MAG: Coenzyme PQQ synthesis protein D [Chloroflexi bacterium ADurb.Bin325]
MDENGDQRRPRHHPRTAARVFSGEAVVISPAENMVRMFNPVGSRIWELADGRRTVEEIARRLTEEYAVELAVARAEVKEFVDALAAKDLLTFDE